MNKNEKNSVQKRKSITNGICNILLVCCVVVFLFSGWQLVTALIEYQKGEETYETILQETVVLPDDTDEKENMEAEESKEEELLPSIDWTKLKNMNDDLIGWLYIPDTAIQYPIVSSTDNDYYLHHTFDKSKNACGCIFMDKDNQIDFSSDNTVLHGHNMKNGTMFGSLRKFEKKSYWESHPYIWIIRENTAMKYEIFSVGITEAGSEVYTLEFGSSENFDSYLEKRIHQGAAYETDVNVTSSDKILTLSTCTSDTETGRRVVQAKLICEKVIQQ